MTFPATDQPLTNKEFERLAGFLDNIEPAAMNMEPLDGYFAASIAGPEMVMPSEYLPEIWGEDFSFATDDQASDLLGLLMRHWNMTVGEMRRTLSEPQVYLSRCYSKTRPALRTAMTERKASCSACSCARQAGRSCPTAKSMAG